MFHQTFPEGDPFGRFLATSEDKLLGGLTFEKTGKGKMTREVIPDGIECSYEEGNWKISVYQTEGRVCFSLGNFAAAIYDRDTGGLVSFEISLIGAAIMASRAGIRPAVERAGNAWEMIEEGRDIRMIVDLMGRKSGITFFRTNIRGELVEIYPGAVLDDVGEGVCPQIVFQEWHGETPFNDLPVRVLVEEQGIEVVISDRVRGWTLPVRAYFGETITADLTAKQLKKMIDTVYPTEDYSKE
jgi:hypothetical protein